MVSSKEIEEAKDVVEKKAHAPKGRGAGKAPPKTQKPVKPELPKKQCKVRLTMNPPILIMDTLSARSKIPNLRSSRGYETLISTAWPIVWERSESRYLDCYSLKMRPNARRVRAPGLQEHPVRARGLQNVVP